MTAIDTDTIREQYLRLCPQCDTGMGSCACPPRDVRDVLGEVLDGLEQAWLQAATARTVADSYAEQVADLESMRPVVEAALWWYANGAHPERGDQMLCDAIEEYGGPEVDDIEHAVRTVARRVLANATGEAAILPEWEHYPEIGLNDWEAVLAEVHRLAERADVQGEHYEAAYRHLAGRATDDEEMSTDA